MYVLKPLAVSLMRRSKLCSRAEAALIEYSSGNEMLEQFSSAWCRCRWGAIGMPVECHWSVIANNSAQLRCLGAFLARIAMPWLTLSILPDVHPSASSPRRRSGTQTMLGSLT